MLIAPGLALALIAAPGLGDTGAQPEIRWETPLECPDVRWLEHRVDAYLGRALEREPNVRLAGRIAADDGSFVLELGAEVGETRERWRLTHHDCAALVEIAASLIAIAIDPLALGPLEPIPDPHEPPLPRAGSSRPAVQRPRSRQPEKPRPELAAMPEALPAPMPAGEAEDAPAGRSPEPPVGLRDLDRLELWADDDPERPATGPARGPSRTRLLVNASGGLALGLFPGPAPQVRGALGVLRGNSRAAFVAELAGSAALAGRFRAADGETGGNLVAWDIALRPCAVPRFGIVELRACASFGAGQIRARGVGVSSDIVRGHPWLWLAAEAGVAVELRDRVALFLDLGADFNLLRPTFSVSNPSASYLTPVVAGHGRLGVELRFF